MIERELELCRQVIRELLAQRDVLLAAARDVVASPPHLGPDTDHVRVTARSFAVLRSLVESAN